MEHDPPLSIPEDYKAWATITSGESTFSVPCKVFLPKSVLEWPEMYIFPNPEQFDVLPRLQGRCTFEATIGDKPDIEIFGEDVRISGGSMRMWEEGLEEAYLRLYPARLLIQEFGLSFGSYSLRFRATPSLHLSPNNLRIYNVDGSADIRTGKQIKFALSSDFAVSFLYEYRWQEDGSDKTVTFPELVGVAEFDKDFNYGDVHRYISMLDQFLLLVSLAEGQRCTVPVVEVVYPDKLVKMYRLDRALPRLSDKHSFNDFVVDSPDVEEFLTKAWVTYVESKQSSLIRTAMETITNDARETAESRFLSLFSAIETMVLAFRRETGHEYIVDDKTTWNRLKKRIARAVSESGLMDKESRRLINSNCPSLNRVPLETVFNKLLQQRQVESDDLWPFFSRGVGCSLTDIRNGLVHGEGLSERFMDSFFIAKEHLEYYALRVLLATLGWDYEKSRMSIMREPAARSWHEAARDMESWKRKGL